MRAPPTLRAVLLGMYAEIEASGFAVGYGKLDGTGPCCFISAWARTHNRMGQPLGSMNTMHDALAPYLAKIAPFADDMLAAKGITDTPAALAVLASAIAAQPHVTEKFGRGTLQNPEHSFSAPEIQSLLPVE